MTAKRLRPVGPNEKAPTKKSMLEAINTRDDIALHETLRERLVVEMSSTSVPPHVMAPIARQIAQLTERLDELVRRREAEAEAKVSEADEKWDADAI
jgi:hypothetical protein